MPKTNCAVVGCGNCTQKINKWKTERCATHGCNKGVDRCICDPPFRLLPFPTRAKSPERRKAWTVKLRRMDSKDPKKYWEPNKNSRICSVHFEDGENIPCLNLGHSSSGSAKKRKPPTARTPEPTKSKKTKQLFDTEDMVSEVTEQDQDLFHSDGDSSETMSAVDCVLCDDLMGKLADREDTIKALKRTLRHKERELQKCKRQICRLKFQPSTKLTYKSIRDDEDKVHFYTGLPKHSAAVFDALHSLVAPLVKRLWRGNRVVSTKYAKKSPCKRKGPERKLCSQDELLLLLMRLRLGLMNKDVSYRLGISPSLASEIFTSWLKAMHTALKHLVHRPSKEAIYATRPARFSAYPDLRDIIDCSEIFIESPKDLHLQALCWSDYKHHSTIKFLISVTPTGMISFVSNLFCGRASDKAVTRLSGFLDTLEPYDQVMADKGFLIYDELATRLCSLAIPPGKRGNAQMTPAQVAKNKKIANARIIVEQVIRKLKCFKMLKYIMPITLVPHADNILTVCAGLCNLQTPINT